MKITIVSDMIKPFLGGGETYCEAVAEQLIKLGHEVTWVGMRMPNTKEVEIRSEEHTSELQSRM